VTCDGLIFRSRDNLHLICRLPAVQPVGVNKHFGRAEYVEHPHRRRVDDRKQAITVQSLLDMTSGIEWTERLPDDHTSDSEMARSPDWVKFILDRPMSSAPGESSTITVAIRISFPRSSQNSRE
jgi:hypothetical protein